MRKAGRHFCQKPGPVRILSAMRQQNIDHRDSDFGKAGLRAPAGLKSMIVTERLPSRLKANVLNEALDKGRQRQEGNQQLKSTGGEVLEENVKRLTVTDCTAVSALRDGKEIAALDTAAYR